MTVGRFVLTLPGDKQELAELHQRLVDLRAEDVAELRIVGEPSAKNPLDHGRALQFVLTWGAVPATSKLVFSAGSGWWTQLETSPLVTVAAVLADVSFDAEGADVTNEVSDVSHDLLERYNRLGEVDFAGAEATSAHIVLPTHVPRLSHSPDTHSFEDGAWRVDEEARTLYHAVWPEPDKPSTVREPWFHLGEKRVTTAKGTTVVRRFSREGEDEFRTLAERTLRPRGSARAAAMGYRVREKTPEDELGEVLFELIQNTQWHGLDSAAESGRSLRVLRFAVQNYTETDLPAIEAEDPALAEYLAAALRLGGTSSGTAPVLTLGIASIIDSGLGLARSVAGNLGKLDELDEPTEIEYLRMALNKTVKTSFRHLGNIGLPRVQLLMTNLRGFMTIRTGSLELRRDFIKRPIEPRPGSPLFAEWVPSDYDDFFAGPRVGTDVTLMLPIDYTLGDVSHEPNARR